MKIIGIIVLVLVAYLAWGFVIRGDALVLVTPDTGKPVTAAIKRVIPDKEVVFEINNNGDKEIHITEISVPRSTASKLGLSEPSNFRTEELPLAENDRKDKELVEFVEKFNRDTLRWVGNFALAPGSKSELVIPAASTSYLTGVIKFQYEHKSGFGGSGSFLSVDLAEQESNRATQPAPGSGAAEL